MKVELTPKEQDKLNHAINKNPVYRFLSNKDNYNFEVGDVLIKKVKRYDPTAENNRRWAFEPISPENPMPQRYVFIHKDEYGIGYMKQLKVSTGQLGKELYCLTDYDQDLIVFEVDPEYAEQIFLDTEFDIKDLHKKSLEARKIITKMNRKTGIKFRSLKESNSFFFPMKPGDKFWMSSDYTAKWVQEMTIVKMTTLTVTQLNSSSDWAWNNYKSTFNPLSLGINDGFALKLTIKEDNNVNTRDVYAFNMGVYMVFYKQAPALEEKKK